MFLRNPERQEDDMGREGRDYWEAQLSEYWDSGLTIQEYSELKELPYESARRWILWLYLLYDFTKSSGYFRWNCNLLTICKRPASSMVMVDRGEIFSKGEMATK